jgi:hypothetical protein
MIGSKLVTEEDKENAKMMKEPSWDDVNTQSKLLNMLSLTSNIEDSYAKKNSQEFKINKDLLLNSEGSISTKKSIEFPKNSENMLFVKKKEGQLIKLKSDFSDSDKEGKETLNPKDFDTEINDNKKSLFDISREPGEFTNLLGK